MKKIMLVLIECILFVGVTGCSQAQIVGIPSGYVEKYEYYDKNGFQDYTDYAKYVYSSKDNIIKDSGYKKIFEEDINNIKEYFNEFSKVMESDGRMDEFNFDESIISKGDYVKINTKEGQRIGNRKYKKYDNYSIYFFDIETLILYYIHNNI